MILLFCGIFAGAFAFYCLVGAVIDQIDAWLKRRRPPAVRLSTKCPRPDRSARR